MPISLDEYRLPEWVRSRTRYPLSEDSKDRFIKADDPDMIRRYPGGFKLPGYNPNHNSTRTENINLESDDISLKGR